MATSIENYRVRCTSNKLWPQCRSGRDAVVNRATTEDVDTVDNVVQPIVGLGDVIPAEAIQQNNTLIGTQNRTTIFLPTTGVQEGQVLNVTLLQNISIGLDANTGAIVNSGNNAVTNVTLGPVTGGVSYYQFIATFQQWTVGTGTVAYPLWIQVSGP